MEEIVSSCPRLNSPMRSRTLQPNNGMNLPAASLRFAAAGYAGRYHLDICDECRHLEYSYNSCRNRHCPRCQGIARRRWVNARLNDLLPIPYYHAVFTLPHTIFPLSLYNKTLIYELLFQSAAETLLQFGNDPKWLGALIGFYGILHTWGGKIWQHLHLHFIVTGGGLSEDDRWIEPKHKGRFLFPVWPCRRYSGANS